MEEIILGVKSLPKPLSKIIRAEHVKVREENGIVSLIPIEKPFDCTARIRGMFANTKMSVDKFMENKRAEKELEL